MPNWCENEITITGDISEIVKSLDSIENKEERNVFKTLIGLPDGISQEEYEKDWYNINLNRFGTKWDISCEDCEPQEFDDVLVLTPNTAWSPPTEFCVNLAKKYGVEVEMYYYESGMDFCGKTYILPDGTYIEDDYKYMEGQYRFESDYFWLDIRDNIENSIYEGKSLEQFMVDYPYLSEEDKQEVIEIFKDNESIRN
jgi:hypothetical protein